MTLPVMKRHHWQATDGEVQKKYDMTCAECGLRRQRRSGQHTPDYALLGRLTHVPPCTGGEPDNEAPF